MYSGSCKQKHISSFWLSWRNLGCLVFGKRRKNILQDGDFFQYSKNYFENTYHWKGNQKLQKTPEAFFRNLNLCDEILNNEPTTNNQTKQCFKSFTADQPGIQNRREDTLAKLLLKELKDKTYTDPKLVQSARTLERNIRFKLIVNSPSICCHMDKILQAVKAVSTSLQFFTSFNF